MDSGQSRPTFATVGFWVPCDQAAFMHHEKDKYLRKPYQLRPVAPDRESGNQEPDSNDDDVEDNDAEDAAEPEAADEALTNQLNTTVLRRLAIVLYHKGYTYMFPVYHESRKHGEDPDAAIFVNPTFTATVPLKLPEDHSNAPRSAVTLGGMALLVNSSGYYLWITQYDSQLVDEDKREDQREQVELYLRDYVFHQVGGTFSSHYSGLSGEKDDLSADDKYEKRTNLQTYRDQFRGIFTFLQLNVILEGLYSSTLDFQVFFYGTTGEKKNTVKRVKRRYSVGNFARMITARVRGDLYTESGSVAPPPPNGPQDDEADTTEADTPERRQALALLSSFHQLATWSSWVGSAPTSPKRLSQQVFDSFLPPVVCEYLLRKFLQATASEVLQKYKRRIERCRRALLSEMLQVTHRQQPLLQVEVPDFSEDHIDGVNESQLRGYVMLLSAKLPILENVKLYLEEIGSEHHYFEAHQQSAARSTATIAESSDKSTDKSKRKVNAALTLWLTIFEALTNDLRGLERAVEQARRDRLVQEEEQIRVEQETLAEIERLQERHANSLSPTTTLSLGLLSNAFALASVVAAVIGIARNTHGLVPPSLTTLTSGKAATFLAAVLGLGAGLSALYFLAQYGFSLVLRLVAHLLHIRAGERYYYELDLHMDAPLDAVQGTKLLDGKIDALGWGNDFVVRAERTFGDREGKWVKLLTGGIQFWSRLFWPTFRGLERNSYRIERQAPEEAMHKVYLDATMLLRRRHWYQIFRPRVPVVLVYEVLYHRPAQSQRYILKDLRVISTTAKVLKREELAQIKTIIADNFVNQQLTNAEPLWRIRTQSEKTDDDRELHHDALLSLTGEFLLTEESSLAAWQSIGQRLFWLLYLAGTLGALIYVVRVALNVLIATSSHGPSPLATHQAFLHLLALDELGKLIHSHGYAVALPVLAAAALVAAAEGVSFIGRRLGPVVEKSLTWLPPAQPITTTLSPEKEQKTEESALIPPSLPLLKQWGQSAIRGAWISLGLLGWVVQWLAIVARKVLAVVIFTATILLGTIAIADFVKWLFSSLQH